MLQVFQGGSQKSLAAQSGFTLIELIVAVAIIAILSAIAIPSYRQYIARSAQHQAQAKMKQLQLDLESWRANSLTYKGFVPKQVDSSGSVTYAYMDCTVSPNNCNANTSIAVPDATNPKYTITLIAGKEGVNNDTLAPVATNTLSFNINYNAWRMLAVPSQAMRNRGAPSLILTSNGKACMDNDISINHTVENDICSGARTW